ncbi:MAG: motility protein A, partial [Lachnospiraceae bacterium]|nr:motility protein A [Lachnospiraceae bacterium]
MDPASLIGIVVALVLMIYGITGSNGMSAIFSFLDRDSAVITFGGAFMAVMAGMNIPRFVTGLKSFTQIFSKGKLSAQEMIKQIINLSNVARREGLLSLEEAAGS